MPQGQRRRRGKKHHVDKDLGRHSNLGHIPGRPGLQLGGGGDSDRPDQDRERESRRDRVETQAETEAPTSTKPQTLDLSGISSSQREEPARTETSRSGVGKIIQTTEPSTSTDVSAQAPEETPAAREEKKPKPQDPAKEDSPKHQASIEDLIPEDPQTNEKVLLQDIYAQVDLSQFELDPEKPLMTQEEFRKAYEATPTRYKLREVWDHPYLHLFPRIYILSKAAREQGINPHIEVKGYPSKGNRYRDLGEMDRDRIARGVDRINRFIHSPWFEPVRSNDVLHAAKRWPREESYIKNNDGTQFQVAPHYFGENSTRTVIAEAIAEALNRASRSEEKKVYSEWTIKSEKGGIRKSTLKNKWSMEEYLRTPLLRNHPHKGGYGGNMGEVPRIRWEFAHPKLPIVKITATQFDKFYREAPWEEDKEPVEKTAAYAVSLVVSFQNRWTSFDDPNRWLTRFEEYYKWFGEEGYATIGTEEEMHQRFPNYWHHSDYMQHRIIGPIVVQTFETQASTRYEAFHAGVYSATPRISEWQAPGPILKEYNIILPKHHSRNQDLVHRHEKRRNLATRYRAGHPNPGWPLPGHVMAGPESMPGTERWKKQGLDFHEW